MQLLTKKNASKNLGFYDLAVHVGDVPMMRRSPASRCNAWDPTNVTRWKCKVGSHNIGIQWDTSMPRGAGEGNDWIKNMMQRQPREEVVLTDYLSP